MQFFHFVECHCGGKNACLLLQDKEKQHQPPTTTPDPHAAKQVAVWNKACVSGWHATLLQQSGITACRQITLKFIIGFLQSGFKRGEFQFSVNCIHITLVFNIYTNPHTYDDSMVMVKRCWFLTSLQQHGRSCRGFLTFQIIQYVFSFQPKMTWVSIKSCLFLSKRT